MENIKIKSMIWRSKIEAVDLDTGEAISLKMVAKNYNVIGKNVRTKIDGIEGTRYIQWQCRKRNQLEIFEGND